MHVGSRPLWKTPVTTLDLESNCKEHKIFIIIGGYQLKIWKTKKLVYWSGNNDRGIPYYQVLAIFWYTVYFNSCDWSIFRKVMIKKPFPSEHPYTSHISQFAVFPKFDSAACPKRGSAARRQMPKDPEMPANNNDVTIVQKVKGSNQNFSPSRKTRDGPIQHISTCDTPGDLKVVD